MPKRTGVDSILSKCHKKCLSADSGVSGEGSHHGSIMEGHPNKVETSKKLPSGGGHGTWSAVANLSFCSLPKCESMSVAPMVEAAGLTLLLRPGKAWR